MDVSIEKKSFDIKNIFYKAIKCCKEGEEKKAKALLRTISTIDSLSSDDINTLGIQAFNSGLGSMALEFFKAAVSIDKKNLCYLVNIGNVCLHLKKRKEALYYFQRALDVNPDYAEAYNGIGSVFYDHGNYRDAALWYTKAVETKPLWAEAYFNTGKAYKEQRKYEPAIFYYNNALRINPDMADACYNLGNIYFEMRKYDEAILWYEKVITLRPDMIQVLHNLGKTFNEIGMPDQAENCCRKAIQISPNYIDAYMLLVVVLIMQPHSKKCQKAIDEALLNLGLRDDQKKWLLTQKAIISWIRGDLNQTISWLGQATCEEQTIDSNSLDKSTHVYQYFLSLLADFRVHHSNLYAESDIQKIYIIGDSHALGYARTKLMIDRVCYAVESKLIMGLKAHHLKTEVHNQYKQAFHTIIEEIPENSAMIMAAGEIDCRTDGGIYPLWKKRFHGKPVSELIEKTVTGYVDFVVHATNDKKLMVLFYGVPAPLKSQTAGMSEKESQEYIQIPRLFNELLQKCADNKNCGYIDVYSMTSSENGFSNGFYHMDGYHLYPSALSIAMENNSTSNGKPGTIYS